jgi:hypothetical protein
MKHIIHVNQHKIRAKAPNPLTVKNYRTNQPAASVDIVSHGHVVARIVYRPDSPLPCGARVWVETTECIIIHTAEDL